MDNQTKGRMNQKNVSGLSIDSIVFNRNSRNTQREREGETYINRVAQIVQANVRCFELENNDDNHSD